MTEHPEGAAVDANPYRSPRLPWRRCRGTNALGQRCGTPESAGGLCSTHRRRALMAHLKEETHAQ